MLSLGGDDEYERPVGAKDSTGRRSIGLRQIVSLLLVLLLGGALGTAAYFLSDVDARDLIGFLDVGDPQGPKLKLRIPGQDEGEAKPPGDLLTPPKTGADQAPATPAPAKPAAEAKAPDAHAPDAHAPALPPPTVAAPPADPHAPPVPAAAPKPVVQAADAPPSAPTAVAIEVPAQPTPRPAAKPPAYADLPTRNDLKPLAAAPLKELQHDGKDGPLPVVAADGRQAWKLYGRPFNAAAGTARVAVVVTELGLDRAATEAAIGRLPPEVSLAFSPYAVDLPMWVKKARAAGHEVLIALPAEAAGIARDTGPLGLMTGLPPEENVAHLEIMLTRLPPAVGVVAANAGFAGSPQAAPVLAALLQRGLLYVGPGSRGPRSPASAVIAQAVDQDPYRDAIDARLEAGLATAKAQGAAVLLAAPRPVTFDRLANFLSGLSARGASAAPVSAVVGPPGKP